MKRSNSFSKILLIFFITFTILSSLQFFLTADSPSINSINQNLDLNVNQANEIPSFWNLSEIQKIPLNITIEKTEYNWEVDYQKNFTIQYLYYTSQSWNDSQLRCYAALIIPDNSSGQLTNLPAVVLIHGLRGSHSGMMDLGYLAASYNYSCLVIDLPGHGSSGGPPPTQEWIIPDLSNYSGTITPDILNHTHFYLIARAAVRAVDVLINQSFVDSTRIAMSGGSYGGLTTMFASNVYWQGVRSAIPVIAAGNLDISFATPWSITNFVVDPNKYDISVPPYSDLVQYFDPIHYVNTTNNPATLFICGTNDDFFPLETFNSTFHATHNDTKGMSMSPGGHHGILMKPIEGTILYWLNYTMGNGPAPPEIDLTRSIESTFFGSKLKVIVNVTSATSVSNVVLGYHHEVMGFAWDEVNMTQINQTHWTIEIDNLPVNAEITYLVMVELEGDVYTMFSSSAWRDTLNTWIEIPFFILVGLAIALPIFIYTLHDYRKNKSSVPKVNEQKLLVLYSSQLGGIGVTQICIAVSLFLPLAVIFPEANAVEISASILLSEFIDFFPLGTTIVFSILIFGCILAMSRPLLGGIINIGLPASILIFGFVITSLIGDITAIAAEFGVTGELFAFGIGLILWLVMAIVQICFGIFKRKYQKHLQKSITPS